MRGLCAIPSRLLSSLNQPAPGEDLGSSEDLIYAELLEWAVQLLAQLEKRHKAFGIAQPVNAHVVRMVGDEFPEIPRTRQPSDTPERC